VHAHWLLAFRKLNLTALFQRGDFWWGSEISGRRPDAISRASPMFYEKWPFLGVFGRPGSGSVSTALIDTDSMDDSMLQLAIRRLLL